LQWQIIGIEGYGGKCYISEAVEVGDDWRFFLLAVRALYDAHAFTMSAIKSLLALAMDCNCISEGKVVRILEATLWGRRSISRVG
jgi:hypothetical protein